RPTPSWRRTPACRRLGGRVRRHGRADVQGARAPARGESGARCVGSCMTTGGSMKVGRLGFAVSAALFVLAGCGEARTTPQDGGDTRVVDASMTSRMCTRDFECENGACECLRSREECCHPDVCGESAPTSCAVVCEECTGSAPRDGGPPAVHDGGPVEHDSGPPPPACTGPSACYQTCLDNRTSTSSCVSR